MIKELKPGDTITACGVSAKIATILYTDAWTGNGGKDCYDIEFLDTNGVYRSWKSWLDGGKITRE